MGQRAHNRNRRHRAPHDKGRDDASLIIRGINLQCAHHGCIESQRGIDIDQRCHDRVIGREIFAEQDFAHINRVLRPRWFGHRPHKGLIAQAHMRVQHIKMTLVNGNVGRFAHCATRMVQPFRHIAQFHEFLKISHSRITAATDTVPNEGRAVNRGQHQRFAADLNTALWVAGVLDKRGRRSFNQAAQQSLGKAHALAVYIGPDIFPSL